jgi:hypothetical protein
MLSLSKHGGRGLCARPFDKLRVTGLPAKCNVSFRSFAFVLPLSSNEKFIILRKLNYLNYFSHIAMLIANLQNISPLALKPNYNQI